MPPNGPDSRTRVCSECSNYFGLPTKRNYRKTIRNIFKDFLTNENSEHRKSDVSEDTTLCKLCIEKYKDVNNNRNIFSSDNNTISDSKTTTIDKNIDTNIMPDTTSINSQLEIMMEERQQKNNAREKMRLQDMSQKWMQITAHRQEANKQDNKKKLPIYWIRALKETNITQDTLKSLLYTLRGQTKTWMLEFMSGGGQLTILKTICSNYSSSIRLIAQRCLSSLLDTEVGLKNFLNLPAALTPLPIMCKTDNDDIRIEILSIQSYVSTVDIDTGYRLVYESLTSPIQGGKPFEFLVNMLNDNVKNEVKYEIMVLINALINAPDHLEDRIHTRQQFIAIGIQDIISNLRDFLAKYVLSGMNASFSVTDITLDKKINNQYIQKITTPQSNMTSSLTRNNDTINTLDTNSAQKYTKNLLKSQQSQDMNIDSEQITTTTTTTTTLNDTNNNNQETKTDIILLSNDNKDVNNRISSQYIIYNTINDDIKNKNTLALPYILERQKVQCDQFESAMDEDRRETTLNSLDYSDIYSQQEYINKEILPQYSEYLLSLYQLQVTIPTAKPQSEKQWNILIIALRRQLDSYSGVSLHKDVSQYIEPQSYEDIFLMIDRPMYESGIGPHIDIIDLSYKKELDALKNEQKNSNEKETNILTKLDNSIKIIKILKKEIGIYEKNIPSNILDIIVDKIKSIDMTEIMNNDSVIDKDNLLKISSSEIMELDNRIDMYTSRGDSSTAVTVVQNDERNKYLEEIKVQKMEIESLKSAIDNTTAKTSVEATIINRYMVPGCPDLFNEGLIVVLEPQECIEYGKSDSISSSSSSITTTATTTTTTTTTDANIPICPDLFNEGQITSTNNTGDPNIPICPDLFNESTTKEEGSIKSSNKVALSTLRARTEQNSKKEDKKEIKLPYIKKKIKLDEKMRVQHWTKLDNNLIETTIWNEINDTNIDINVKEQTRQFKQDNNNNNNILQQNDTKKNIIKEQEQQQEVVFVVGQRRQNISIAISRFKPLTYEQIRDYIQQFNYKLLPQEKLLSIASWLPLPDELEAQNSYDGPIDNLGTVEKYFSIITVIPDQQKRLDALIFKLQYKSQYEDVDHRQNQCRDMLNIILGSKKQKRFQEIVLAVGNHLNAGTNKGEAYGFKLQFVTKLSSTRSVDNKTNLLVYIIKLCENDKEKPQEFVKELNNISEVSRIEQPVLQSDVMKIVKNVNLVKNLVEKAKDPNEIYMQECKKFLNTIDNTGITKQKELEQVIDLSKCVAFKFGEDASKFTIDTIFSLFADLTKQVKDIQLRLIKENEENERRKRLEAANIKNKKLSTESKLSSLLSIDQSIQQKEHYKDGPPQHGNLFLDGFPTLRKTTDTKNSKSIEDTKNTSILNKENVNKKDKDTANDATTLRTKVDSALRGDDPMNILKEMNARRAARTTITKPRRLFGSTLVSPPPQPSPPSSPPLPQLPSTYM